MRTEIKQLLCDKKKRQSSYVYTPQYLKGILLK